MNDLSSLQPVSAIALYEERVRDLKALRDSLAEAIVSLGGEEANQKSRELFLIERKIAIYDEEIAILQRIRSREAR